MNQKISKDILYLLNRQTYINHVEVKIKDSLIPIEAAYIKDDSLILVPEKETE